LNIVEFMSWFRTYSDRTSSALTPTIEL
jgi:hypothetical protein